MSWNELERQIASFERKSCGVGATQAEIERAEVVLGLGIVGGHRLFLRTYGWMEIASSDLFGLGEDVPGYLDLIKVTLSERTEMHPNIPHQLLPIMNDGAGNHYCIDTACVLNGESPIVFWNHELGTDQIPEEVADCFTDWFSAFLSDG